MWPPLLRGATKFPRLMIKERQMNLYIECVNCKHEHVVQTTQSDLNRYMGGELVQKVYPDMGRDEREALIGARTGMFWCGACDEIAGVVVAHDGLS